MLNKINGKVLISVMIALLLTVFLWHNLLIGGTSIIIIFIFIACYATVRYAINIPIDWKRKSPYILSFFFALAELVGKSIKADHTLNLMFDKWILINFIGQFVIALIAIRFIFYIFENNKFKYYENNNKILKNRIFIFILCTLLMFAVWLPYFLQYYPGVTTPDSFSQLKQVMGVEELSNHHPVVHTAIIAFLVKLGIGLDGNINTGIACYSICSMLVMAMLNSTVILYLIKKKVPTIVTVICLLFYMFYPVNAMYSITMWKDIFFSGVVPIFVILCIEIITNTDDFLKKKSNIFIFIIFSILTMILRHNGFYIVILSMPFMFIVLRKHWKKILPMFIVIILCNFGVNFIIFNVLNATKGSVAEMLSIPVQQIARVEKYHRDELDEETINEIRKFFKHENVGDRYYAEISDSVKSLLDVDYFEEHKMEFVSLWLKLVMNYPKDCIEAFASNSYGYYYPEATNWVISTNALGEEIGVLREPKIKSNLVTFVLTLAENTDILIIPITFSVGAFCWTCFICLGYKLYKKEHKYLIIYLPILILWLTLIASPVYCEFRYAYPILMSLPVFISMNFIKKEN